MIDAMPLVAFISMFLFAEAGSSVEPWWNLLVNGGIGAAVIGWFMWRDKHDSERRDKQHDENGKWQRDQTKALNLMTRAMMVQVLATRHMDDSLKELASKIRDEAETDNEAVHPS